MNPSGLLCRMGFHNWMPTTDESWTACRWCGRIAERQRR